MLSLPGTSIPSHYGFSLTPGDSPTYLAQSGSSTPHQGVSLNLGGILGCPIWLMHAPNFVMALSYRSV